MPPLPSSRSADFLFFLPFGFGVGRMWPLSGPVTQNAKCQMRSILWLCPRRHSKSLPTSARAPSLHHLFCLHHPPSHSPPTLSPTISLSPPPSHTPILLLRMAWARVGTLRCKSTFVLPAQEGGQSLRRRWETSSSSCLNLAPLKSRIQIMDHFLRDNYHTALLLRNPPPARSY